MFRVKKYLQLVLLVSLFLATGVFLLHQKSYRSFGAVDSSHAQEVGWQERAPRSLSGNDYENNFVEVLRSTATPSPSSTSVADLFISVKTTVHYHQARLPVILKTWFQLAKQQTWFFTDSDDPEFQKRTNGHMVNTNCSSTHNRKALCCKMSVELDAFLDSDKK
ncbi:Fringe-like [Nesidiocoris tenuis]|uniref:Fringe-like n=1 Tax=Nesidiocoris tenuis TaxID=355587 RepID=A0ABN7B0C1_9HEMI|nr:Fringe-like [Nesidiocoris tenuis]